MLTYNAVLMEFAVETRGLARVFGAKRAVDGIDLHVPAGSFYGFLGPNGAGKSTTIKCLTGLLRPSAGEIRILGLDPGTDPVEIKRRVGVVPEDLALFDRLTAAETLSFVGQVHGIPAETFKPRSTDLLALMDLTGAATTLVADFSHGMRKKLALAAALLPAPRLLFLDEPFEGIDPVSSRVIADILRDLTNSGTTIFFSSHILAVVERLCTRVGIVKQGQLIAEGTLADLRQRAGASGDSLEDVFLDLVGANTREGGLEWLE
jgi:ABC-2 type transport system ATP-binding protein